LSADWASSQGRERNILIPRARERRSGHPKTPRLTAYSLGAEGAIAFAMVGRNRQWRAVRGTDWQRSWAVWFQAEAARARADLYLAVPARDLGKVRVRNKQSEVSCLQGLYIRYSSDFRGTR